MKEDTINQVRNVCIAGHGGSGKTTLTEAVLFTSGSINRMGTVETGNTSSDYREEEIERHISIGMTPLFCTWNNHTLNWLDTPGYADFTGEVKCAIRVADSLVLTIRAIEGVEVETDRVCAYADELNLPRMMVVTLLDKEHADFYNALAGIRERFGQQAVPIQLPIGAGESLAGVVDLITMKALIYDRNGNGRARRQDIPADLRDRAAEYRERLMETAAESSDELLELYFDQGELTDEQLVQGLKQGVHANRIYPVLCSAAVHNIGASAILDAVTTLLPSPADRPPAEAVKPNSEEAIRITADAGEHFSALVFKTIAEPHIGELSYFRVYAGEAKAGTDVSNVNKNVTERLGQMYRTLGRERHEIGVVRAGDIAAVVKLKDTHTGDTLCDRQAPVQFPGITFSDPVVRVAIAPKSKEDEEKISMGLSRLHEEDPSFVSTYDGDIKQLILAGAGEMHLDMVIEKLKRRYGVEVEMTRPRVPYRETIKGKAEAQGRFKRQSGGRGQFGDTWIRIEPLPRGAGYEFVDAIVGGAVPNRFIPAVDKGIQEAMEGGVIAGYPVVDMKVTLYDGSYHTVDSSELAFKVAASMGFKKAVLDARPVLLEPVMEVEVVVPEEFMGDVMGDLSSRRGRILGMDPKGGLQVIRAEVPLAELYKYSTSLRSMTQGRGSHARKFARYEEVPHEVSEKVIAEARAEQEK